MVIPFNCIAHPFCASFFGWWMHAQALACWKLDRFSMKVQLFREINGCYSVTPTLWLHDIFKFEEFFVTQFWNIPIDSLLQSDCRRFTYVRHPRSVKSDTVTPFFDVLCVINTCAKYLCNGSTNSCYNFFSWPSKMMVWWLLELGSEGGAVN